MKKFRSGIDFSCSKVAKWAIKKFVGSFVLYKMFERLNYSIFKFIGILRLIYIPHKRFKLLDCSTFSVFHVHLNYSEFCTSQDI